MVPTERLRFVKCGIAALVAAVEREQWDEACELARRLLATPAA